MIYLCFNCYISGTVGSRGGDSLSACLVTTNCRTFIDNLFQPHQVLRQTLGSMQGPRSPMTVGQVWCTRFHAVVNCPCPLRVYYIGQTGSTLNHQSKEHNIYKRIFGRANQHTIIHILDILLSACISYIVRTKLT